MPNNPRLAVAREYLGLEHRYAETMLTRLDAEDPMRREPSGKAMEAALDVMCQGWRSYLPHQSDRYRREMRKALTAALAVMAGESVAMEPGMKLGSIGAYVLKAGQSEYVTERPGTPVAPTDPPPPWTPELAAHVLLMSCHMRNMVCHSGLASLRQFTASERLAFPITKSEPVWPPEDCKYPQHCCHNAIGVCADPGNRCPHAGERANG